MQLHNLVVVDIETTGLSPTRDRVIEIGMVVVNHGEVVDEWDQLINPDTYLSPYITSMTGIETQALERAPTFPNIAEAIIERLEGRTFVAHNARFDYSFLKQELKRVGYDLKNPQLCTATLSRQLFPFHRHHNLDALIERHQLICTARHRALGDAQATFQFLTKVSQELPSELVSQHIKIAVRRPSLPPNLKQAQLDALPTGPGVYIFYGDQPQPLYIGKSIHIRERVREHFYNDTNSKEFKLRDQVRHIEAIETAGEIEALLTESDLIKKHLPLYNQRLRYYDSLTTWRLQTNEAGYLEIKTVRNESLMSQDLETVAGIFKSVRSAKQALMDLAQEHDLCLKLLSLEKTTKACFHFHLKKCRGACVGQEPAALYNFRLHQAVEKTRIGRWPFSGPIAYAEHQPEIERTAIHVFDHWCYVGSVAEFDSIEGILAGQKELRFDVDVFQILRQMIFGKKHKFLNPKQRTYEVGDHRR